jgi:hypothetical protein
VIEVDLDPFGLSSRNPRGGGYLPPLRLERDRSPSLGRSQVTGCGPWDSLRAAPSGSRRSR